MVEKQCILTEHKEGSGGLAAPADSLTLACHKGESGIGGVSSVGLPATKWEEMALPAQQWLLVQQFFNFFASLKQQQNLMKIMFSCIQFPVWPYPLKII